MIDESRLLRWMLLSLLVHGLLLSMWPFLRHMPLDVPTPKFLDVDLAALPKLASPPAARAPQPPPQAAVAPQPQPPAIPLPNRQIVAPPDAGEEKAPANTRLLSDRDNTVPEEQVKHAPLPSAEEAPKKPDAPLEQKESSSQADTKKVAKAPAPREARIAEPPKLPEPMERPVRRPGTQVAALPKLDQLLPPGGDFAAIAKEAAEAPEQPTPASRGGIERRPLPLGNSGVPAFSMHPGTSDFLPGVRPGDITLLNTKAERFAPFVRRVAARVFQHLDIRLRQTALSGVASSGREYAVVEAIMSRQGQLVNAKVLERQSTSSLGADRVLLSVTQPDTFFDANPPPGAEANDGNIHFILLVDLQVQAVQDARTGRVYPGYNGIAGVGLDASPEDRGGG